MIHIDVRCLTITVTGDTYPIRSTLGTKLGFKFDREKKRWTGQNSLKALETLQDQSGAILTPAAHDELQMFYRAAEKRAAYLAGRRAAGVA